MFYSITVPMRHAIGSNFKSDQKFMSTDLENDKWRDTHH